MSFPGSMNTSLRWTSARRNCVSLLYCLIQATPCSHTFRFYHQSYTVDSRQLEVSLCKFLVGFAVPEIACTNLWENMRGSPKFNFWDSSIQVFFFFMCFRSLATLGALKSLAIMLTCRLKSHPCTLYYFTCHERGRKKDGTDAACD